MSPAQTNQNKTKYFKTGDTAPPLTKQLKTYEGDVIDLTDCTVTISIAYAMRSGGFVLFPRDLIVYEDDVTVTDAENGWVSWTPGELGSGTGFETSGRFQYSFNVTYSDGTHGRVPTETWWPLVVQPRVGGPLVNQGASSSQSPIFPPASP